MANIRPVAILLITAGCSMPTIPVTDMDVCMQKEMVVGEPYFWYNHPEFAEQYHLILEEQRKLNEQE